MVSGCFSGVGFFLLVVGVVGLLVGCWVSNCVGFCALLATGRVLLVVVGFVGLL